MSGPRDIEGLLGRKERGQIISDRMRRVWLAAALAILTARCGGRPTNAAETPLDAAAESYVRLVLALGERDPDSLDMYHGPPAWRAEARTRYMPLEAVRAAAASLADTLASSGAGAGAGAGADGDEVRRRFLIRQLRAVAARVDIVRGARPRFADEARALFGLDAPAIASDDDPASVRAAIDRLVPGRGDLPARYAAFDRTFLIPADRLDAVLSRAIEGCRAATRAHLVLPADERVDVAYVHGLAWSAFTRYQGRSVSRIQVNASLPLTVDRALDLACHEAYPGHHAIDTLLDARFGRRVELLVRPLFSPQALLHEAAASVAGTLAFPEPARIAFERDQLFPLAALDPASAERHVHVGRLVDRLYGAQADIARRYLDGDLDFPRAAAALERDALMPSADATLKFLNQYRTYAATYTIGRGRLWRALEAQATARPGEQELWRSYNNVVAGPAQILPPARAPRQ
jgi:hypothetical protein